MAGPTPSDDDVLWRYAVDRYSREGVQPRCLSLQDEAGVDVAFAFACVWLSERGTPVDEARASVTRAFERNRALRDGVLAPVRAARRRLKTLRIEGEREPVRNLIKEAELAVEAAYVARLHVELSQTSRGAQPTDARAIFDAYLMAEGLSLDASAERTFAELAQRLQGHVPA